MASSTSTEHNHNRALLGTNFFAGDVVQELGPYLASISSLPITGNQAASAWRSPRLDRHGDPEAPAGAIIDATTGSGRCWRYAPSS